MTNENHLQQFVAEQTKDLSTPARKLALKAIDIAKAQRKKRVPDSPATRQDQLTVTALKMAEDNQ